MTLQVGKDVVSYCTSCRMDLTHTVVAVDGEKIKRVLCQTCKKEHAFRLPEALRASSPAKRSAKSVGPRKGRSAADDWEADMVRLKDLSPKVYTLDGSYEEGEKLDHGSFGLGLVKKLVAPDKMEVLFEQGVKLMIRGSDRSDSRR